MKHNAYIEKKLGKEIDQVSREELIALVNEMKNEKKYGLVWENQVEEMEKLLETHYPMLQEDADKAIVKDPAKPTNLIIEGDNLHSLNTLLYTHREKVDVIYIDPPYNTGNKDFVYNDHYVDKENAWRHSTWLSFMEKRLKLAKELLSENGVIFISIDDNEQSQLKLLCDDVFGENNFISNIVWTNKEGGGGSDSKYINIKHEYILVYSKTKNGTSFNGVEIEDKDRYKLADSHVSSRGKYQLVKLDSGSIRSGKSLLYEIEAPDGTTIKPGNGIDGWCWRWSRPKFDWGIENDYIVIKKAKDGSWNVYTKQYTDADNSGNIVSRKKKSTGVIDKFSTTQSNNMLKEMFGTKTFNYSKPVSLISYLLKLHPNPNAVVLDFFAGSGTTGHGVLELNAEDGGNRQFILCTHGKESETSEVNIAEDITYERIKRVINGYSTPKGKEVDGVNGNVRYYKTVLVDKDQDVNDLKAEMAQHAKDLLCIKDNAFAEVVSLEESFLFESNDVLMGIHLGEHYEIPESLTQPLTETSKERILYLKVDDIPTDEEEVQLLLDAKIDVKPIPKKIMDLFDESTRRSM